MQLKAKINQIRKSGFLRSVGILVGGTAFGQVLMVLAIPVLTRLYTPEDFSVLAVYASLLGILSVTACLGLDLAVSIPEKDEDAVNLLALALCFTALTTTVTTIIIFIIPTHILTKIGLQPLIPYRWMLPVGVFFAGSYSAVQFFAVRQKDFLSVSKTRITQSITAIVSQIGLGWVGFAPFGLLFGQMLSGGSGIFFLGRSLWVKNRNTLRSAISLSEMRRLLSEYKRFPQYSTFESLTNSAGVQVPIIAIAALAAGPEAGFLLLAIRVMQAPMGLIGKAISQVYLSKAPEEYRRGNLGPFTEQVVEGLLKTGVGPIIFAGIVAPPAFSLIFGEEWLRAGELVSWMTLWFAFQFLSSPISMVMHVKGQQRAMLIVTVTGLIIRLGSIMIAAASFKNSFSEFYALSGGVFYFGCYFIFSKTAGITLMNMLLILWRSTIHLVAWSTLGILIYPILC